MRDRSRSIGFESAVKDITGFKHVIPTHQGRAAEHILLPTRRTRQVIPNNTHFDTTRANVEYLKGDARDLVIAEGRQPQTIHNFKGNMDLDALRETIKTVGVANIPFRNADRDQQLRRRPAE